MRGIKIKPLRFDKVVEKLMIGSASQQKSDFIGYTQHVAIEGEMNLKHVAFERQLTLTTYNYNLNVLSAL